jgi:glyoxylase-like metal-dependent hydrolase (beta-lactamase superfamily II)
MTKYNDSGRPRATNEMRDSSMPIQICNTCGTSYPDTAEPPSRCLICEDERQYVPRAGQTWTTPEKLARGHVNAWRQLETDLFEIHTRPQFGIGQRALLLRTPEGNILWDCITLLDDATKALVRGLGGLRAIAISHPHYYTCMQDWARAFDCPVHLHAADAHWIMRPDSMIRHWEGETLELAQGLTLLRLGGHFPGGTVLHWADGADGRGALLSGDIVQVAGDVSRVSFLWSYPNMMPLAATTVRRIAETLVPWRFERIYGAFPGRQVMADGARAVQRSAARYIELLEGSQL